MVVAVGVLSLGLGGAGAEQSASSDGGSNGMDAGAMPLAMGAERVPPRQAQGQILASLSDLDGASRAALSDGAATSASDGALVVKTGVTSPSELEDGTARPNSGSGPLLDDGGENAEAELWRRDFREGLREEGTYQQGVRHGLWKAWRHDGTLRSTGQYVNGLRDGVWESYSGTGALLSELTYEAGSRSGDWVAYSESGAILEEGQYSENVASGRWTTYYSGGQIKERGLFVNGLREGAWEFYDDLGLPTLQAGEYRAGIKIQ